MLSGTAPSSISFSTVNVATLPEPDTSTRLPSIVSSLAFSISTRKYTTPYPVASVRINDPPQRVPLPVSVPDQVLVRRLYWPNK